MATAQNICSDALKECGALAEDETMTATMADDALRGLNMLVEQLSNTKPFAYVASIVQKALTGQPSFTVGLTGNVIADAPIKIESATFELNNAIYNVAVLTSDKWELLQNKTQTGSVPIYIYYEAGKPNGKVNIWPIVNGGVLKLNVLDLVVNFPDLTTEVLLPAGYQRALTKALCVDQAPIYGMSVSQLTLRAASASMRAIKRANLIVPKLDIDCALPTGQNYNYLIAVAGN
jgi:hypothetical protein